MLRGSWRKFTSPLGKHHLHRPERLQQAAFRANSRVFRVMVSGFFGLSAIKFLFPFGKSARLLIYFAYLCRVSFNQTATYGQEDLQRVSDGVRRTHEILPFVRRARIRGYGHSGRATGRRTHGTAIRRQRCRARPRRRPSPRQGHEGVYRGRLAAACLHRHLSVYGPPQRPGKAERVYNNIRRHAEPQAEDIIPQGEEGEGGEAPSAGEPSASPEPKSEPAPAPAQPAAPKVEAIE